jgi:hypothetical protein
VKVAERSVELRGRVLELAEVRLKAGDASALEVSTAQIDAHQAAQELIRLGFDVGVAQGQVDVAKKVLEAATARRDLLKKVVGDLETGTAAPIPVGAPEDGVLRNVTALPGQTVPAGAALFEVADLTRVWVRVPVYAGDLSDIDPARPAAVGELAARPSGTGGRPAGPVSAPPTANPISGTVDLYYDLDNRRAGPAAAWFGADALFNPGQRVGITLGLKAPGESLTVPWSAVVFDVTGGAWVYEKTGERAYSRRRVVVRYVAGDTAVLESGPPPGTPVVTVGAAELFGTETGFSK